MTARKAIDQNRMLNRQRRGGGNELPKQLEPRFPQETPAIGSAFCSNQALASGCAERTPETQNFSLTSEIQFRQFHARGGLVEAIQSVLR